jgi:hypothetical protein
MTWREAYAPRIAEIIKNETAAGKTVKHIKKILSSNNPGPWGHQKKIWSDESLKQLGLKKRKVKTQITNLNQTELFT